MSAAVDWNAELAKDVAGFTHDPVGYMKYAYPWGTGELADSAGPRKWQAEVAAIIGKHLSNPATRHQPLGIAVSSGHGIGKSAEVAMLIDWGLNTCEDTKIVLTANTFDQLRTKTWPEVSKWQRLSITSHWWDVTATSIKVREKSHAALWRADAISWSENNTEAFAGLHNKGKRILLIFDEASAIADKVWEVAEGALTDEDTEIIWLAFGNPTKNTGRFRECFGNLAHRWHTFQIDSRTVEGTNKEQLDKYVQDYGEDSDFVRVRVRGEFPRAGTNQFIPADVVATARKHRAEGCDRLPKIGACDVARFGADETVIADRQGRKSRLYAYFRKQDTVEVGIRCAEYIDRELPDAFVVDGDGIGAGVFDYLKHRGYDRKTLLVEFHGGAQAQDSQLYFNKRAEVWGLMRDWAIAGAEIADDPTLGEQMQAPTYGYSAKGQLQLEKKEDLKERLPELGSPDRADALAMTFGVTVVPRPQPAYRAPRVGVWS